MTNPTAEHLLDATTALAEHLEAENAALEAFELGRAARMLERKKAVAENFARVQAAGDVTASDELKQAASRLMDLITRNSTLLADGIKVQARVVRIVAEAAARAATPRDTRYGASGALPAARPRSGALFARA